MADSAQESRPGLANRTSRDFKREAMCVYKTNLDSTGFQTITITGDKKKHLRYQVFPTFGTRLGGERVRWDGRADHAKWFTGGPRGS